MAGAARQYVYTGVVLDIHDGDTVKVQTLLRRVPRTVPTGDSGFHVFIEDVVIDNKTQRWATLHCPFRLLGINAPELSTDDGKYALAYMKTLIQVGSVVTVRSSLASHVIDPDKYGDRWLGVIIRRRDGLVINDEMIAAGHAKPWDGKGVKPA